MRSQSVLAAIVVEFLLALLAMAIPGTLPPQITSDTQLSALVFRAAPAVKRPPPPTPTIPLPPPRVRAISAPVLPAPRPKIEPRPVRMTAAPVLTPEFHAPPPVEQPKRLREPVHTGVLSASVAPPVTKRPLPKVQTGGFGDPHGVSAAATPHRGMAVATVGSFGSPVGPGSGNGTGGRRGARGEIAQAGFGDAAASPAQSGTARHGAGVRAGVFSDQAAVPATSAPAPPAAKPSVQPVEILAKPDPVYTAEARAHKIEGNVLLEVIFAANGKVEVLRVLEGLGYGLDQAAISAARRIRFRPERDNGKPVDARARLRIVFRLAY